jgi:hypothetical protein
MKFLLNLISTFKSKYFIENISVKRIKQAIFSSSI